MMLVFPHWRPDIPGDGCRVQRWMPAEHFGSYFARPIAIQHIPPPQTEDDDSSGCSSPERNADPSLDSGENVCEWRGCGARYPNIARLSEHVARAHAHPHTDGHFYCGWKNCRRPQRGFNARYKMLVHVRTHTNERPHTCTQCNKSFSRAENLKIHMRSHSGEKPYVCPFEGCGKAYSNSSDRFKHTRTHTVDKPYYCKVPGCNKRYTDPSSLRKHVKTNKHFTREEDIRRESSDEIPSSEVHTSLPTKDNSPCHTVIKPTSPLQMHTPIQMHHSPPRTTSPIQMHHSPPRTSSPIQMHYSPPRTTSPIQMYYSPPKTTSTIQMHYSPPKTTSPIQRHYSPSRTTTPMPYTSLPPKEPTISYPLDRVTYLEPMYPVRVPSNEMSYLEYTQMYEHAYRNYYSSNISYSVLPQRENEKPLAYDKALQYEDEEMKEIHDDRYVPEEMPLNLICTKQRIECRPIEQLVMRTDLPLDLSTKS